MQISRERMGLVGNTSEHIFGYPCDFHNDYSLSALLRAIIIDKTEWTPESVERGSTIATYRVSSDEEVVDAAEYSGSTITFCEARRSYTPSEFKIDGWRSLNKAPHPINEYLGQFAKTTVLVNDDRKRVLVVVKTPASAKWFRGFLSTLPRVMTWLYPNGCSKEDQDLCRFISVDNTSATDADVEQTIVNYVNKIGESIDIRNLWLHKCLDDFQEKIKESQLTEYRRSIDSDMRSIRSHQRDLEILYGQLADNQRILKSLQESGGEGTGEVFDFFSSHKCIDIVDIDGSTIRYGVTETLEFYDEDEFVRTYNRTNSYLHGATSSKDIPKLMNAIFAEHKGVFVTNAVFTLKDLRYIRMKGELSNDTSALPHPHIYFFQCSGGNDQYYSKYADSGEWQLAVEQSIGATKNINFGDSIVVGRMMRWLDEHRNIPCIKIEEDGSLVTVNAFIKKYINTSSEGEKDNG